MVQRVFLTGEDMAAIECPLCRKTKLSDFSRFKHLGRKVTINVSCPCGHTFQVLLERRRHFRKFTNFPGAYKTIYPPAFGQKRTMTVKDVSMSGLRLKVSPPPPFKKGDRLSVEFRLDDHRRSLVKKEVIVRSIADSMVGAEFCSKPSSVQGDKELGFYLLI